MKVSLFLGAGASTSYWMPTTRGLKEDLAGEHAKDKKGGGEPDVWRDLLSDSNGLDIEHVMLLADTVDGLNKTEPGRRIIGNSGRFGLQLEEVMRLGRAVRREVFRRYAWDHDFDESADGLLGPLVDMAMALNGDGQVTVFTTNYDRAVEEFCEGRGLRMRDGFRLDTRTGRRMWAGNFGAGRSGAAGGGASGLVKLHKLHGSLDWKYTAKHGVLRVDYDGFSESDHYKDVLLHPSLADKSGEIERKPYNEIHDSFKKELASSDACVVVGFSFRDGPIAAEFRKFAELDGRTLIVVGPAALADAYRHILEQDPPGGGDSPNTCVPERISAVVDGGKGRRAVVIRNEWTDITNDEITTRIRSVIEAKHDLRPVTTYGNCTECTAMHTIGDMEDHVSAYHYEMERVRDGEGPEGSLPIKTVDHYVGAPWMLALARPGATLGDLGKFLEEKWMSRYNPDAKSGAVKFGPRPTSGGLDPGTVLSGLPDEVTAWCSGTERLRVSVAGPAGVIRLREPVKAYAFGEKPPFE